MIIALIIIKMILFTDDCGEDDPGENMIFDIIMIIVVITVIIKKIIIMIPMIVRTIPVTTRKTPMVIALQACHRHPVVILQ